MVVRSSGITRCCDPRLAATSNTTNCTVFQFSHPVSLLGLALVYPHYFCGFTLCDNYVDEIVHHLPYHDFMQSQLLDSHVYDSLSDTLQARTV